MNGNGGGEEGVRTKMRAQWMRNTSDTDSELIALPRCGGDVAGLCRSAQCPLVFLLRVGGVSSSTLHWLVELFPFHTTK